MKNSVFSNYKVFGGKFPYGAGGGDSVHNGEASRKGDCEQVQ